MCYRKNNRKFAKVGNVKKYTTDYRLKEIAHIKSNYNCELNCGRNLFLNLNNKIYLEGHHFIPMKVQKDFNFSLDNIYNIVSLCPSCHREIHNGKNRELLIKELYNKKIKLLRENGFDITLERLIKLYD